MQLEGAPGISAPVKSLRRFSIRAAHPDNPITSSAAPVSLTSQVPQQRAVPRWRAGMLQRQISKKNLQRRVRAFSLSDVHSDTLDKSTAVGPSNFEKARPSHLKPREFPSKLTGRPSFQKSVTIISPARQPFISRIPDLRQGHSYKRGYSESEVDSEMSYLARNQDPSSSTEANWESASLFPREDFNTQKQSDESSKSFTIGSDDFSGSTSFDRESFASSSFDSRGFTDTSSFNTSGNSFGISREGVVNPRFVGLKPYPSYQGATKLATVYSDDRLSCHDPDKSDSSYTSECVIAFKRKSASDIHESETKIPSKESSTSSLQIPPDEKSNESSDSSTVPSVSATSEDAKLSDRKVSIVSIEPWSETSRQSRISQNLTPEGRRISYVNSPSLSEVRVEDPVSPDQFKTTMEVSLDEEGSLMEVMVEGSQPGTSSELRSSTSSEPQESTSSEPQESESSERKARKSCPN